MLAPNLITLFTRPLEQNKIVYMVTGSVAAIVYGEPRLTHDIDMVLHLTEKDVDALIQIFSLDKFYCPPKESILLETKRETRAHFNIIHHESGFKADCYLIGNDPLHHWGIKGRRRIEIDNNQSVWIAPPEYVIIRKLEFHREGGSVKHIDDICKMLKVSANSINMDQLIKWIHELGLVNEWEEIKKV